MEDIRLNLTTKEDIVGQITRSQQKSQALNEELDSLDQRTQKQRLDNQKLNERIEELKDMKRNKVESNGAKIIQELEYKLREADMKLSSFIRTPPRKTNDFFMSHKSLRSSPASSTNHRNFPIVKIVEDINEIKSIMVKKNKYIY